MLLSGDEKKTKGAAFEKKNTKEKKDMKGAAKNTKAPFKPLRPAEALVKAPADNAADEAGEDAGEEAGEEAGEAVRLMVVRIQ